MSLELDTQGPLEDPGNEVAWLSAKLLVVGRDIEMSFIPVSPENHFPVKNLPYGVFSTSDNVSKLTQTLKFIFTTVTGTPGGGRGYLTQVWV